MRRAFILAFVLTLPLAAVAQELRLPNKEGSVKFAVIGDSGEPSSGQIAIARQMHAWRSRFPFTFALMTGDNLYGSERARDYERKFSIPYKALLDGGVQFYASLGNHDDDGQTQYKAFNMNGQKYYTFKPQNGVRFFAIDSNYVDQKQLQWLDKELEASGSDWKIVFFHHPLYSSGATHGSADLQRELIEPVLIKHGVNVAFMGHEHFYERIKPQKGVAYFIIGSSAKLRKGDLQKSPLTVYGNDETYAFMLVEIAGDELFFQVINDKGQTIDTGSVRRAGDVKPNPNGTTQPVVPQAKPSPVQPGPKK
ncbi:MAG TPA: metallophosphoesterase [Vicinamibacterales bacterium]|nr:metallophosphoesterase [Vicinamibacterales bacterium]